MIVYAWRICTQESNVQKVSNFFYSFVPKLDFRLWYWKPEKSIHWLNQINRTVKWNWNTCSSNIWIGQVKSSVSWIKNFAALQISACNCNSWKWLNANHLIAAAAKGGVLHKRTNLGWKIPASFTLWALSTRHANPNPALSLNEALSTEWYARNQLIL